MGAAAAAAALNAGVDMEMVSRLYHDNGARLVQSGRVPWPPLTRPCATLRINARLGLFANPYGDEAVERATLLNPQHLAAARELAARSFVLLKNDRETLPIRKGLKRIAVIGPLADDAQSVIGAGAATGASRTR